MLAASARLPPVCRRRGRRRPFYPHRGVSSDGAQEVAVSLVPGLVGESSYTTGAKVGIAGIVAAGQAEVPPAGRGMPPFCGVPFFLSMSWIEVAAMGGAGSGGRPGFPARGVSALPGGVLPRYLVLPLFARLVSGGLVLRGAPSRPLLVCVAWSTSRVGSPFGDTRGEAAFGDAAGVLAVWGGFTRRGLAAPRPPNGCMGAGAPHGTGVAPGVP